MGRGILCPFLIIRLFLAFKYAIMLIMTKEEYVQKTFKPREELNGIGQYMFYQTMADALVIMLENEDCTCVELNCLPSWCPTCEDSRDYTIAP